MNWGMSVTDTGYKIQNTEYKIPNKYKYFGWLTCWCRSSMQGEQPLPQQSEGEGGAGSSIPPQGLVLPRTLTIL